MSDRMTAAHDARIDAEKRSRREHLNRLINTTIDQHQVTLRALRDAGICHGWGPKVDESVSGEVTCSIVLYAEQDSPDLRDAVHFLNIEVAVRRTDHDLVIDVRKGIAPRLTRA